MPDGIVVGIFIAPEASAPTRSVDEVKAVAGQGLEGDRYFLGAGSWSEDSGAPEPSRNVTMIEAEALEAVRREEGIELGLGDSRRNIVTRDVALNHLVGREFTVGDVRLRGIRLCEPCAHLEKLNGVKLVRALLHRAGLRAEILGSGTIRVGDAVTRV